MTEKKSFRHQAAFRKRIEYYLIWKRVNEYMPGEFKKDELVDIKDYLQLVIDQTPKFNVSLNKTLA